MPYLLKSAYIDDEDRQYAWPAVLFLVDEDLIEELRKYHDESVSLLTKYGAAFSYVRFYSQRFQFVDADPEHFPTELEELLTHFQDEDEALLENGLADSFMEIVNAYYDDEKDDPTIPTDTGMITLCGHSIHFTAYLKNTPTIIDSDSLIFVNLEQLLKE